MSKKENNREIARRLMALAEILSTVATPEEIQTTKQVAPNNIINLSERVEALPVKQEVLS